MTEDEKKIKQGLRQARKQGCIVLQDGTYRVKFPEQKVKRLYGVSKATLFKMRERHENKLRQQEWDGKHHPRFVKKFLKQ